MKCLHRLSQLLRARCPTIVNLRDESIVLLHCFRERNEKNWSGTFKRQGSSWISIMNDLLQKLGGGKKPSQTKTQKNNLTALELSC